MFTQRFPKAPIRTKEGGLWTRKINAYRKLGVYSIFYELRDSYGYMMEDSEAAMKAQEEVDEMLSRWKAGEDVEEIVEILKEEEGGQKSKKKGKKEVCVPEADAEFCLPASAFSNDGGSGGKGLTAIQDVVWVYNNMGIRFDTIDPKSAPSPGAYAYLRFVQGNPALMSDFYTKIWPKLIPSRTQLENTDKYNDDNREHFELLDRFTAESRGDTAAISLLPVGDSESTGV
jgi:hypothetical protein